MDLEIFPAGVQALEQTSKHQIRTVDWPWAYGGNYDVRNSGLRLQISTGPRRSPAPRLGPPARLLSAHGERPGTKLVVGGSRYRRRHRCRPKQQRGRSYGNLYSSPDALDLFQAGNSPLAPHTKMPGEMASQPAAKSERDRPAQRCREPRF